MENNKKRRLDLYLESINYDLIVLEDNIIRNTLILSSKCGHDNKRIYILYKIINNNFSLILDGKYRKICNPKLKRNKHLYVLGIIMESNLNIEKDVDVFIKKIIGNYKKQ